jgi:hypothetical protein
MKRFIAFASLLPLLCALALPLSAQQMEPDRFPVRSTAPDLGLGSADPLEHSPAKGLQQANAGRRGGGIASIIGAGIVGGWLGYVGAQVTRSDWAKSHNGQFSDQRVAWVTAGAVMGVVGVRVFPGLTGSRTPGRPAAPPPPGRTFISGSELRESTARHALELIQTARPEWLVVRGTQSLRETARGSADGMTGQISYVPGDPTILVYLDGMRLGGVQTLADVPVSALREVAFLDAQGATLRFGGGHGHGAIVLSTRVEAP